MDLELQQDLMDEGWGNGGDVDAAVDDEGDDALSPIFCGSAKISP